jgi:hypothetical protein
MLDRVIWRKDLEDLMHVTSTTVGRWKKAGKLPPPDVSMSRKVHGWRLSTLRRHGINLA